jgi:hypothetical protein
MLEYWFVNKNELFLETFNKYTISPTGNIINDTTGTVVSTRKKGKYNVVNVYDDNGKYRMILVGRAIASTFHGRPPTPEYTADHIDRNPCNDTLENIRWLCKKGQNENQSRPETLKTALIVVKDGIEKTTKGWVEYLKNETNRFGREYTEEVIKHYAARKHHGFAFKEYPDLPGEIWKMIPDQKTSRGGHWEISDMNRIKFVTKYSENVISGERLGLVMGYPKIKINGRHWLCHILAFKTFFPEEYAAKKPGEIIMHEKDDKLDFRPHTLRIGTHSENGIDSHDNGKRDGTKTARMKCISYINGVLEKEHRSQAYAERYLKSIGFINASAGNISNAIIGTLQSAYGRTWERSM